MERKTVSERNIALALDVGGTNIKAGILTREGKLLASCVQSTPAKEHPEAVIIKMLHLIRGLCAECELEPDSLDGIGISMAAFLTADGVVTATAHLSREWLGYDLKARLHAEVPLAYYFSLDTPAPTLGEAYYGAGQGVPDLAYVTVSTGIGAGILVGGQYFVGGLGWAGGMGHIILDEHSPRLCEGCGNHGCLETFAAKNGIITTAQELTAAGPAGRILELADGNPANITPRLVYQAATLGDPIAQEVFRRAGHALGLGLVSLTDIVAPTRIIIGGGIAQAGELLLGPARAVVRERAFPPRIRQVEIVQAALGDLSGIFGAAAMVFHDLRINTAVE